LVLGCWRCAERQRFWLGKGKRRLVVAGCVRALGRRRTVSAARGGRHETVGGLLASAAVLHLRRETVGGLLASAAVLQLRLETVGGLLANQDG
jgi:hypothetical protein